MTDHDALLHAVFAAPDDDLPRLVFADFLEESGHPANAARAAYIRLQIEAERLPEADPARGDLVRKAAAVRESFADEVDRVALDYPARTQAWNAVIVRRRGFVEEVRVSLDHVRFVADNVMAVAPVTRLQVTALGMSIMPPYGNPVSAPLLARLRRVQLGPNLAHVTQAPHALEDLLGSADLTGLRELVAAGNQVTDPWIVWAARQFAQTAFARTLEVLDLSDNHITDAGANTIAAAPGLDGLRVLDLSGNRLTQAGIAMLRRRFGERLVV